MEPEVVSDAVLYLASDEARFITGTDLRLDAGMPSNLRASRSTSASVCGSSNMARTRPEFGP
jgi:hypothetical protein